MKPARDTLRKACPDVDEAFLNEHLLRLGARYFKSFEGEDICRQVRTLSRLTTENPVEVLFDMRKDGSLDCTVLAFDYPTEFSIITGILAGSGYSIVSGDVFTYSRPPDSPTTQPAPKGSRSRRPEQGLLRRRRIIDHFSGLLDTPLAFRAWADEFTRNLGEMIRLLEKGDESSVRAAKHRANEMVVKRLARIQMDSPPVLYPVRIEMDNESGSHTRMRVVSEDTPAFLYALTNALSLHGVSIEHVRIRTILGRVEDEIDLVDARGQAIQQDEALDRIKLSVLLTKQFTYFLGKAPDPYAALSRFEYLVDEILRTQGQGDWLGMIKNPHTLQDLAKLLGASDYLWEDFIRLQYETLLPVLRPHVREDSMVSEPGRTLPGRLGRALKGVSSLEEQRRRLNEFKDREIFLIDLDHILNPKMDFRLFAEKLTNLAENVVNTAARLLWESLRARFGTPRSVGGLEATYAILGLGKLGGAALGYASDIELLFVYSDNGRTDGEESIDNAVFFDRLVRDVNRFIEAKREGIFHVDLRLRPYGQAGPLACSLETFCRYYGPGGKAHAYERLALVRMRAIGGDVALGARLERLRDEMVYSSKEINLQDIRHLREKQFSTKTEGGRLNAKFSPGGLVDLEYGVQVLQVIYGKQVRKLRTPRIHEALEVLAEEGVILPEEAFHLTDTYFFLRRLINGMRMLRGSATDLFLPSPTSLEFDHLARRMGYERATGLEPGQKLRIDFETHSALVRAFVEKYFGRESLPGPETGGVADLVLSDRVPANLREKILLGAGFRDPQRAYVNLRSLAGEGFQRNTFAKLAVLASDILMMKPDPDMALNNWERFIHSVSSPEFHYKILLSQPMRLEMLLSIFSGSQFLADTLVRNPGFLDWVMIPEVLHRTRKKEEIQEELRAAALGCRSHREWLNKLRRFRRREMLRIGTHDICLGLPVREVMMELSALAEAITEVALERAWASLGQERWKEDRTGGPENRFCVMALGKLGGNELNYSSDIDLLGICEPDGGAAEKDVFVSVMEKLRADLSEYTEEGYVYRVDLRLRPYGRSGDLVPTVEGLFAYYRDVASLWEIQALLKIRPIAGNLRLGYDFMEGVRPIFLRYRDRKAIVDSIQRMRRGALKGARGPDAPIDLKNGFGGLRDAEFLVQGLQMAHAPDNPVLLEGNTLTVLDLLREAGILPEALTSHLKDDYSFLRRVEHYLQIMEDRQIHSLPEEASEVAALARRMLGNSVDPKGFMEDLRKRLHRIHEAYVQYLIEPSNPVPPRF
jgi:glutamate-ammonia-ligase adenylyltransferase